MWRPDNWVNPYELSEPMPLTDSEKKDNNLLSCGYEAGADDMLRALIAKGYHMTMKIGSGTSIFIGDEEVQDES